MRFARARPLGTPNEMDGPAVRPYGFSSPDSKRLERGRVHCPCNA
jgi:hypothetical protein